MTTGQRISECVRMSLRNATKTVIWLAKIMICVSFGIMLLQYFGVIQWVSNWMTPIFSYFGLPGEAALAYVSGYFVNCYSAMAVMVSLNLDTRAVTILAVMVLCSHNMIVETTVQYKTGSSAARIVVIRTLSAFILAWILNKIMPNHYENIVTQNTGMTEQNFIIMLEEWAFKTLKTTIMMVILVYLLTILQRILSEFGIIGYMAKFLKPIMQFFGLPPHTAFLWLIANTLGLAYGAAIMIDESEHGNTSKEDNDLLNHHICVSHSNLEDLLLFTALGGSFLWMLLSRLFMAMILVWERKIERILKTRFHISH